LRTDSEWRLESCIFRIIIHELLALAERRWPDDPLAETIARRIIDIGATTIRDPAKIAKRAVEKLGISEGRVCGGTGSQCAPKQQPL
jgi:hypothetical protein